MKKIVLLYLAFMATLTVNAQKLTVSIDGQEIENGANVDSYTVNLETQDYGNGNILTRYQLKPEILVSSSVKGKYGMVVTNTTTGAVPIPNSAIQFCWPDGCIPVEQGKSIVRTGELPQGTPTSVDIDSFVWNNKLEETFTLSCEVTIEDSTDETNSFTFNLNMIYDPNHLAGVSDVIDDFDGKVEYYDLTGKKITNPQKGKIVIVKQGSKAYKTIIR